MRLRYIFVPSLLALGLLAACRPPSLPEGEARTPADRERHGLSSEVKAVLTDDVILVEENGQWFESQQASSVSVYDQTGRLNLQTPHRIKLPGGYAITEHEILFDPVEKAKEGAAEKTKTGKYVEHDSRGNVIEKMRRANKNPGNSVF